MNPARDLVLRHGWNSTSYQVLNPGIGHWFDSTESAVVGYVRRYRFLLVVGAPVCAFDDLPRVVSEFEEYARKLRCRVCYVCAERRIHDALSHSGRHASVVAGEQPVWDPRSWPDIVSTHKSLRAQIRRAINKGVVVTEMAADVAAMHPEVAAVLASWLVTRGLPPLHFMVEPDVLRGALEDRLVFAASRHNRIVAYLVASPVPRRNGWFIEELARTRHAPNGVAELLIDVAMRRFASAGCEYATMGLVALARESFLGNPWWLRTLMSIARAHANRFYNFRGLEQFRSKMQPLRWDPIWFISSEPRFSLSALYAVGGAFSGISPLLAIALGMAFGMASELGKFARRNR